MHAADDDSIPVPHDAFRMPRGVLKWKTPYLFILLLLGGVYGVLMLAGRLSPTLLSSSTTAAGEPLKLPLLAQLASAFAGLAALVLVLSRAVREIDKRPYVAVAPVLAVFSGLVLAGLHVELSALGTSSALVAFATLAVALLGGALIVREDERTQRIGWGLVIGPSVWVVIMVDVAKGEAAFASPERAYLAGLLLSTLLLGLAGMAARKLRNELRNDVRRVDVRAFDGADDLSEVKTTIMPLPAYTQSRGPGRDALQALAAHAVDEWRGSSRTRMAIIAFGVALVAYVGVRSLRHGGGATQTFVAPVAVVPSGPPVVQQLIGTSGEPAHIGAPRREREGKPSPKRVERASGQVRSSASASAPAAAAVSTRRASGGQSKSARTARAPVTTSVVPTSSAGLPAWGAVVGESKPNTATPLKGRSSPVPASKPVSVSATQTAAKPVVPPTPSASKAMPVSVAKPAAPIAVAKPVEPPKPVAPKKPLTMDQVLDQVEAAAKAQRKKDGLKAPKTSKRDSELEDLISGATKSKPKSKGK